MVSDNFLIENVNTEVYKQKRRNPVHTLYGIWSISVKEFGYFLEGQGEKIEREHFLIRYDTTLVSSKRLRRKIGVCALID